MHEMSLCEGLVQSLAAQAAAQDFTQVHRIWLEIGMLASVEPEAMRFNFPIVARGTLAEGAALDILRVSGTAWCMRCAASVAVTAYGEGCPRCGSFQMQISDGQQMRIKQLEVS